MNNIPEYTVTQLNLEVKNILERSFEYVKVKGETGPMTIPKSGHAYFSIKENDEVLSCICWKGNLERLDVKIEEGVEYNFYGKVTSFAKFGRSGYQLIINQIEFSGEGSILKLIEERRKYFDKLGYFNINKKKLIPKYPLSIAVITSPTGSVIRDIIQRISARYPLAKLYLCPITVQGRKSHLEIIDYLEVLTKNNLNLIPSLVIFARGGGSLEEMMPFNEPDLIEKVFNFKIPTISAIGHETDYTLLDYVSDLRAPTPSAAAEISTPDQVQILKTLNDYNINYYKMMIATLKDYENRVKSFSSTINVSIKKIFVWQERIDFIARNQIFTYKNSIILKKEKIQLPYNLISQNNPHSKIKEKTRFLKNYTDLLSKMFINNINIHIKKISFYERLIKNSSIEKNLNKGYSLVFNEKKLIKTKKDIEKINNFKIRFRDGDTQIHKK